MVDFEEQPFYMKHLLSKSSSLSDVLSGFSSEEPTERTSYVI